MIVKYIKDSLSYGPITFCNKFFAFTILIFNLLRCLAAIIIAKKSCYICNITNFMCPSLTTNLFSVGRHF